MKSLYSIWQKLSAYPGGKWLFTLGVQWRAPYFATMGARIVELSTNACQVHLPKRRAVHNHIGTVHAIAICNAAEMAMGVLAESRIHTSHRWIPQGMQVRYLAKAATSLRVSARLPEGFQLPDSPTRVGIVVEAQDNQGQSVFQGNIDIWVTPRQKH